VAGDRRGAAGAQDINEYRDSAIDEPTTRHSG
jgi:hypothetical protein